MDSRVVAVIVAVAALAALAAPASVEAQSATQVVRFQVNAINQIAVSGNPAPLVLNSAAAGSAPTSVTANSTYAVTTNEANQKITASIDQALPIGVTLDVTLAAPAGAASIASVPLSTSGADVVTGISSVAAGALPITYRLSATPNVQMAAPAACTVTFTIVSGT